MNQPSRDQIEARITALLLGELPAAEAELLRWTISQDTDLQKLHDELESTIVLVREAEKNPAAAPDEKSESLKLCDERRKKLLAHFKTPRPQPKHPLFWLRPIPFPKVPRVIEVLVVVAVVAMLAAMLLPATSAAKKKAQHLSTLGGTRMQAMSEQLKKEDLQFRTWSADNADRAEAAMAAPANAPATVTLAPELVLAPPPVQIFLPSAEPSAPAIPVNGSLADSGNAGVSSQNAGGYVNVKNSLGLLQPVVPADGYNPGAGVAQPPAASYSFGGAGGGGGGGGLGGAGTPRRAILVSKSEPDKPGIEPPPASATPDNSLHAHDDSEVNRSRSDISPGVAGRGFSGSDIREEQRLPGVSSVATVDADDERQLIEATRKREQEKFKSKKQYDGFSVLPPGESAAKASVAGYAPGVAVQTASANLKSLQAQFSEESKQIEVAQQNVEALRQKLKIADQGNASALTPTLDNQQLQMINQQMIEGQRLYHEQLARLQELKSTQTKNPEKLREVLAQAVSDATLTDLLNKRKDAQQMVETMTNEYALNNANLPRSASLGVELDRQIDDRVVGVMAGLESQVNAKKAALEALTQAVETAKKKDQEDASKNQPYYDAKRKLDERLRAHELLYSKLQTDESRLGKELNPEQADAALSKPAANAPVPQPEILTRENAFSTFSLNVSDVSFKLAAASLEKGQMPDAASIRSEEFINAFDYHDPEAVAGQPLAFASERARYPFAHNRDLLRFSIKTAAAGRSAGRALNLVLLLDNSGSMERADRVQIIREALRVLATQLQPQDTVSVVTFARTARLWADGVAGDKAGETLDQVGGLTPQGGTNLEEAMRLAYETARRHYLANGMNRVVLLTDGAANLGNVDAAVLQEKVEANRKQGIALDCFGIGWEGFNDDLLEQLSSNGDGRYAFLNSPEDASKDFAAKLAGALQVAASDVKVQVEFNPQRVISYRQIGYAKHQLTKEQFRDNTVDAAEIAAQEAGNALYTVETKPDGIGPVATVRVRYKVPGTTGYRERSWDVAYTGNAVAFEQSSAAMRLAATASAFSEWLAASPFAQEVTPDELLKTMSSVPQIYGADERPKKLEWMIRQAKSLSGK